MSERIHAITMPRWGMTMTEGTIAGWLVPEGAPVAAGQDVLEIETTKITNVMEAAKGGILRRRVIDEGTTAPVGALLGVVAGGDVDDSEIESFIETYRQHEGEMEAQAQSGPSPRIVSAGRHRVNVLSVGEGSGTPVVLLHGFGGDINAWAFNQEALADGRTVHAIDLPAHGGSSPAADAGTVDALAAIVLSSLDALGLHRIHLVGHSLGGAISLAIAAREPDRLDSLALIAPVGLGPDIDASYVEGFLSAERRKPMKEVLGKLYADPDRISSDMVEAVLRSKRIDGAPEALRAIAGAFVAEGRQAVDFSATARSLAAPLIVIWGDRDAIIPASQANLLPETVAREVVAGAGHMPQVEEAAEVNRVLTSHFAKAEA